MADYLRELDAREQREQIRDWAVLGTLTRTGATVAQLAAATYQVPPARLPYLDELYAFEYGRGRRAYLANRVLLFRDRDDPDPQATIGRLADRVRMESGEVPKVVELYLVDDQRDQGTIRVERTADLTRAQLFSDAYGYVEGEAHTLAELSAWLNRIDDLSYARLTWDGHLHLGGRRFAATRTENVDIGDIAAIYQSQKDLDQRRLDSLEELGRLPPILTGELRQYFGLAYQGAPDDKQRAAFHAFEAKLTFLPGSQRTRVQHALYTWLNNGASPGFSLDPEWLPDPEHADHSLMLARIRALAEDPCAELQRIGRRAEELFRKEPDESRRTSRTAVAGLIRASLPSPGRAYRPAICARLRALVSPILEDLVLRLEQGAVDSPDAGFSAYYALQNRWKRRAVKELDDQLVLLALSALDFHEQDTQVQCARYEGLAGTSAGMTLFYTDLLAKIWAGTDFGRSAPIADVPGFVSLPQVELAAAFARDAMDAHATRRWFGARASGVSRSADREPAFAFDHRFTRLYAAGNDLAHPGAETQPDEGSRRALGWWDRHFEDVADYEQQYHRQNQIMKWSLVTALLPQTPLGMALRTADVFRDYKFAGWQQSHRRMLRFADKLPPITQGIPGKECIPLLASYEFGKQRQVILGGVSMVGRAAPRAVSVIEADAPLGARLSAEARDLGAGTSGTATRAVAQLEGEAVTFRNAALAPTRTAAGDVSLGTPRVTYVQGASRGGVVIRAGEGAAEIGELEAQPVANRIAIRWEAGPIERARLGKPELGARTLDAADRAARSGRAVDAARVYERGLPRDLTPADRLAREAIEDIAHRRPAALRAKLGQLAAGGKPVSPAARDALLGALREDSAAVARQVEVSLETGAPLGTADTSLTVTRGRMIVTRDVALLPRTSTPAPATDLSKNVVYVDSRLRVGQDGLLPDTGGSVARWARVRNVKVVELKASEIGALPDRIVEQSTGLTLDRAPIVRLPASPRVFVIQRCDAEHRTATTQDDCDRR
ncbi:MAG TPA: hypothetical protein VHW23_05310 [Kofleriaceae bacterium]|nr:hypothetical protein [Kofleriaceae bacterium]